MPKKKPKVTRRMHFLVPEREANIYEKLCIDYGITMTEGFVMYARWLTRKDHRARRLLNEKSDTNIKLDE